MQEEDRLIHIAAMHGQCDMVKYLITEHGVDPTSTAKASVDIHVCSSYK